MTNALVVIPSCFFATGAVWFAARRWWLGAIGGLLISLLLAGLVYSIEFLQLWFLPRTVSQNDILAGCLGAVIGPIAWFLTGPIAPRLLIRFLAQPTIRARLQALTLFGVVGAILYSVFPLDLVVSAAELQRKWEAGRIDISLALDSLADRETLFGASLFSRGAAADASEYAAWQRYAARLVSVSVLGLSLAACGLHP